MTLYANINMIFSCGCIFWWYLLVLPELNIVNFGGVWHRLEAMLCWSCLWLEIDFECRLDVFSLSCFVLLFCFVFSLLVVFPGSADIPWDLCIVLAYARHSGMKFRVPILCRSCLWLEIDFEFVLAVSSLSVVLFVLFSFHLLFFC